MRIFCWLSWGDQMQPTQVRSQVQRVLIITLLLNLVVAGGKIVLGLMTGALAITADGFHSLTDGAGNVAGLVATLIANQPPDDDHPYGHRRFETLAALLIGALLLLTAWEMLQGVLDRWQSPEIPDMTPLAFAVLGGTLLVNVVVSTYQIRAGNRLNSEILLADARNTRADVFITLSVIISMGVVALTGWVWVDVIAALVVVGFIAHAAWQIVQDTGRVLVDTAPYAPQDLIELVRGVPGVQRVSRARSRGPLDAAQIDIDLQVAPEMTADQSNSIAYAVRQTLQDQLHGISEIEVHFSPYYPQGRDAVLTARAYADAMGLSTHEVQIGHEADGCVLEMHVEVPPQQTLAQAHAQVSRLEAKLAEVLPHISRVVTHIEPALKAQSPAHEPTLLQRAHALQTQAHALLCQQYPQVDWHDLRTRPMPHGFAMNLHATLPPQMSMEAAHSVAEHAETLLRGTWPDLQRVIIHTEPDEA